MAGLVARIASIAVVFGLAATGLALPQSLLIGGVAWLSFLFFALSGWGWIVVRVARVDDPDFGLRAAWGIAGYLAVAGVPLAVGLCGRPFALVALAIGAGGFAWRELVTERPVARQLRAAWAAMRGQPLLAYLAILIGTVVVIQIVGAIVHLDRNPWDDDIAYTPLVKRLLDCGDLVEPFSFRRLASYGGHTVLAELVAARGSIASIHALDQGLCYGLVFLLVVGHARTIKASALWLGLVVLAVVLMPDISINTASYWSGAVAFLALYRTVVGGQWVLASLLAAAACTLRQNYIPVAALFLVFTLASARLPRSTWLRTLGVAALVMIPWCIAAFVSSRTFLFPFMQGTWNHGLTLGPSGWSWVDELSLVLGTALDSAPIVIVIVLAPLIAVTSDTRATRPLQSFFLASLLGFALLVHSFTDADSQTMWRYAFGYSLTLFCMFALEASGEDDSGPARLAPLGRWVLLAALLVQLMASRAGQVAQYAMIFTDIREAVAIECEGDPNARVEATHYAAAQATIPPGASVLAVVDDPAFLDFSRNRIANIDIPGFASPGSQMPYFVGPEPMRGYLLDRGIRYILYVKPDSSRYAFRRGFWVWRLFHDAEFFQTMSAYTLDLIDNLAQLATTSHVLRDADGLVVLDLDGPHEPVRALDPAQERGHRDAYLHDLAVREGLTAEWSLTTRGDLVFADGCTGLTFAQPGDAATWTEVAAVDAEPKQGTPVRWLSRRFHLRVRGLRDMHLVLRGRANVGTLFTQPRLDVSVDGHVLTSVTTDATGAFTVDLVVPATQLRGWSDLYVVFNTIGQPERDTRDLHYARLESVTWEPR